METARLRLRPLEMRDAEALNLIQSDPVHMRFYPHPFSLQESREWIERMHERSERDEVGAARRSREVKRSAHGVDSAAGDCDGRER